MPCFHWWEGVERLSWLIPTSLATGESVHFTAPMCSLSFSVSSLAEALFRQHLGSLLLTPRRRWNCNPFCDISCKFFFQSFIYFSSLLMPASTRLPRFLIICPVINASFSKIPPSRVIVGQDFSSLQWKSEGTQGCWFIVFCLDAKGHLLWW